MSISPVDGRPRAIAVRRVLAVAALAVCLTGCTIATPAAVGSSTSSSAVVSSAPVPAARAGASLVVTVPGLAAPAASAPIPTSSAVPAYSVPSTKPAPASSTPAPVTASAGLTTSKVVTTSTPVPPATTSAPVSTTAPQTTPTPQTTSAPSTSTKPSTSAAPSTSAPSTLAVTLANCPGCTVLATHAGVTSTLGAALVATGQGRAALLSLRGDGSVAGAANVLYGSSFPTPPGGQLACDSGGRCIVIAQQADGTAIASAYQVNAAGAWAEVTGQGGIASVTAKAQTLTVGSGVGVAVQDQADGTTVWIVYGWTGDGYSVQGCTTAAVPSTNALSMTACLS